jgi:outer membrane protein assembly factor BamB
MAELAGRAQVLLFNGEALAGHDPDDGSVLWSFPWPSGSEHVSQPLVLSDNRVFLSSGFGVGGKLLEITEQNGRQQAGLVWESNRLKAKFTNVVYRDGYFYGLDDGIMACIDAGAGVRQWKRGRHGHGQILLVGDVVLILSEQGSVVLVSAQPDAYQELASFDVIQGKTWNHPTLAGTFLLVRNAEEAACLRLPVQTPGSAP